MAQSNGSTTRTEVVSMVERAEEIESEEIPPLVEEQSEIEAEAAEYESPSDIPNDLDSRYREVSKRLDNLQGEAEAMRYYAEEWGGGDWVVRELTVGTIGRIQDDVLEASDVDANGNGTPKAGYSRQRTIELAIKDSPNGAPEASELPDVVGDWLFDVIDRFNSTGEVGVKNYSLRDTMRASQKSKPNYSTEASTPTESPSDTA